MKKIDQDDVDRILGIADQFLADWSETDAEQPAADRDATLPARVNEWDTVRPLLVAAPQLADIVEKMLAHVPEKDAVLRAEAVALLKSLESHRTIDPGSTAAEYGDISLETWEAVLLEGLEPGAKWRPCIVIYGPEQWRDQFFWRDTQGDDAEVGPFANLVACVTDVLRKQVIDAGRLTRHCNLDRRTADAVLAFETRVNEGATSMTQEKSSEIDQTPGWEVVRAYFGLDDSFCWTQEQVAGYVEQYSASLAQDKAGPPVHPEPVQRL